MAPAQFTGRFPRTTQARISIMMPATPGRIRPGFNSSTKSPSPPRVRSRNDMLGLARKRRSRSTELSSIVRTVRPCVSRVTFGPPGGRSGVSRPCNCWSSSSTSLAMKSIMFSARASSDVKESASNTVASNCSEFLPLALAMLRISAAAS